MLVSFGEYLKYRNLNKDREKLFLYLCHFPIDPTKVGRKLSEGLQHFVYEYGKNEVVKVPRFDVVNLIYGVLNPVDVEKDRKLIEKHFKKYLIKTKVYSSKDNELYCIVQERVRNKLNINSQNIHLVMEQFNDIYTRNKKLEESSGYSLDLWGKSGILRSVKKSIRKTNVFIEMTNLVIEKDELSNYRAKIIDTNLFRIRISLGFMIRVFTDRVIYQLSDYVLKKAKFLS